MITRYLFIPLIMLVFGVTSCGSKTEEKKNNVEQNSSKEHVSKAKTLLTDTMLGNKKFIFQKSFYDNGAVKQTGFLSPDSMMQGAWTNYYPDGKVESITNYNNGMKDGHFKSYHDNGQLWTEIIYSNDKTMEIVCNFDRYGKPKNKGTLKNGNGTIILYDDQGERRSMEEYRDGRQQW